MMISLEVIRGFILGGTALLLTGCCAGLKDAIREEAQSIHSVTQPTLALVPACKAGDVPACDTIVANVRAIDDATSKLEADAH